MSDLVIVIFVLTVFYFIGNSALFSLGFKKFKSCFQTRQDRDLEEVGKWDTISANRSPPKLPAMYLEGLESREINIDSNPSIIKKIESSNPETDYYGEEPLNDRFLHLTSSTKYSDGDLLNIMLSRTKELPEEEELSKEDIKSIEMGEYELSGNDINNRIISKVKKNNQMAKRNTNCKIPLSAIRDDMELDYAGLEDEEPWWSDGSNIKFSNY